MLVMMMEVNRWLGFITFEFERFAAGLQKWNSLSVVGGLQKQERAMVTSERWGESGKDGEVLWSRREGTLVEWLEDSAGFGS